MHSYQDVTLDLPRVPQVGLWRTLVVVVCVWRGSIWITVNSPRNVRVVTFVWAYWP